MFNILLNWCDSPHEKFDFERNEKVINLEISQKESCFASAKITIPSISKIKKYVKIAIKKDEKIYHLFCGKVTAFPIFPGKSTTQIEAIAEPENYQQQLKQFAESGEHAMKNIDLHSFQKLDILRDDLFFAENDLKNPTTWLEGSNKIFYWDMKTGKLSLSSIKHGVKTFEISKKDILRDSFKIKFAREPYGKINVHLCAHWIQKIHGFVDLIPVLAKEFRLNKINSFSDLESGIKSFSKDGYSVVYRKIEKANPNNLGILTDYPTTSCDIKINAPEPYNVKFRRFYFDGKFIINWEYHQKRKEIVEFSICDKKNVREKDIYVTFAAIQLGKDYPEWRAYHNYAIGDKVIFDGYVCECVEQNDFEESFNPQHWRKLQRVPDALKNDSAKSFFETERGKNAIAYARQKAIALMNYSRRYITIELCVDANKFHEITVNDDVLLADFSENFIRGKVIKTQLVCNSKERLIYLTLGCAIDQYIDEISDPIDVKVDDDNLYLQDIVNEIRIENSPEEQLELLSSQNFRSISEAKNFLRNHATKIRLKLHPISVKREISKTIKLPDVEVPC